MKNFLNCRLVILLVMVFCVTLTNAEDASINKNTPKNNTLSTNAELSVYWVGHSLMEASAESSLGNNSVLDLVQIYAESESLPYKMGDHTLWGAPLSLQWEGVAKSNKRSVPDRLELRKKFEEQAGRYNSMVLTETVPLVNALKYDYSAYYLRKFYCTLVEQNSDARVFLYESWLSIQSLPGDSERIKTQSQWNLEMTEARQLWDQLADDARLGKVVKPGWLSQILSFIGLSSDQSCATDTPINIIPVGTAFVRLGELLNSKETENDFLLPTGEKLKLLDLISNPYLDWPIDDRSKDNEKRLSDPGRDLDDIHASAIGIYFASLVTYATLTKRRPQNLPTLDKLGGPVSLMLQEIAWDVVSNDERTGVH